MPKQGPRTLHVSMSHICRKTLLSLAQGGVAADGPPVSKAEKTETPNAEK